MSSKFRKSRELGKFGETFILCCPILSKCSFRKIPIHLEKQGEQRSKMFQFTENLEYRGQLSLMFPCFAIILWTHICPCRETDGQATPSQNTAYIVVAHGENIPSLNCLLGFLKSGVGFGSSFRAFRVFRVFGFLGFLKSGVSFYSHLALF